VGHVLKNTRKLSSCERPAERQGPRRAEHRRLSSPTFRVWGEAVLGLGSGAVFGLGTWAAG
jgi:hypothetical protein